MMSSRDLAGKSGPWKRRIVWASGDWCYQWVRLVNGTLISGPVVPR